METMGNQLKCDVQDCGAELVRPAEEVPHGFVAPDDLRRWAATQGWTLHDDRDFCPEHSSGVVAP